MKESENIRNRGPKKRDPVCLQVQHDIVIPRGTILRQQSGKAGIFECPVSHGTFTVTDEINRDHPECFKRVIA